MSGARRANGFTLSELIIAVGLASIIFAGLASMYSVVFRAATAGLHQQIMQAAETFLLKHMERDFASATYLKTPGVGGASNTTLEGYYNLTDYGGGKYHVVDPNSPVQHFVYLVCPGGSGDELYYWRETDLVVGSNPISSLPGNTITCGQAGSSTLIEAGVVLNPMQLLNDPDNPNYFTREAQGQVLFQGILDRPAGVNVPDAQTKIFDIFTASSQGVQP